jgi:hypothetical protein
MRIMHRVTVDTDWSNGPLKHCVAFNCVNITYQVWSLQELSDVDQSALLFELTSR